MQYYKDSKLDETMMAVFRSIGNMLAESMRKEGKPDADKKIEAIIQSMISTRNSPEAGMVFIILMIRA